MPLSDDTVVVVSGVAEDAFGLGTDGKRLARLFFQPLLVAWALHSTGACEWLRDYKKA